MEIRAVALQNSRRQGRTYDGPALSKPGTMKFVIKPHATAPSPSWLGTLGFQSSNGKSQPANATDRDSLHHFGSYRCPW
jgi:hypothetical protein